MEASEFLSRFSHFSSAPDGTEKLRELVVQLAVSGRLVEAQSQTEPVTASIMRAALQRKMYEIELNLQASRRTVADFSNPPFPIPSHWSWVRMDDVCLYIQRGRSPVYADEGRVAILSQKCVQWQGLNITQARAIDNDSVPKYGRERYLREGDLLWNSTGTGTVGRAAVYEGRYERDAVVDSHVTVVRASDEVLPQYLWCVISSPWVQARINPAHPQSIVSGTTQQVELATRAARSLPVPLPPIEEQRRIVGRVMELLDLCARLAAHYDSRSDLISRIRNASIRRLAEAIDGSEIAARLGLIESQFSHIFQGGEGMRDLKFMVFTLAARGWLFSSDEAEESSSEVVSRAIAEKRSFVAAREIREMNSLPKPRLEGRRMWASLGHIASLVSGQHLSPERYNTRGEGIPYVTGPADFIDGRPVATKWTSDSTAVAKAGDVLITVKGSGVGKTARSNLDKLAISRQLMAVRAMGSVDQDYLAICVQAAEKTFQEAMFGIAIPGIGRTDVLGLPVLVPGPDEQRSVVRRVKRLIALCTELERLSRAKTEIAGRLVRAAVADLSGIKIEATKELRMKAPQIQLISMVQIGQLPNTSDRAPLATILARQGGLMSTRDLWQRFGGEVDAFYAQLKIEVMSGWVLQPLPAEMREIDGTLAEV